MFFILNVKMEKNMGFFKSQRVVFTLLLFTCRFVIMTCNFSPSEYLKPDNSELPAFLSHTSIHKESRLPEPLLQTALTYYQNYPKEANPEELLGKLDSYFDLRWMSIEQPTEDINRVETVHHEGLDPDLLLDLQELNFTYVDENKDLVMMKPQWQKAVEKWLLRKASCPIEYHWDDIGPFYWPRWIRKGSCTNETPCSWPPGMHCVPSPRPMMIRILRWHCFARRFKSSVKRIGVLDQEDGRKKKRKNRKNKRRPFRMKCRWRKVRYPITTECFCTC